MKRALIKTAAILIPILTVLSLYFEAHASMTERCVQQVKIELNRQRNSQPHEYAELFSADRVDVKMTAAVKCYGAGAAACEGYMQAKINRYMRVVGGLTREQLGMMYWRCL